MHDKASRSLVGIAIILTIILYLFAGLEPLIVPMLLLFGAGAFRVYVRTKKVEVDATLTSTETFDTIYYALLALLGLYVGNLFVENLFVPPIPTAIKSLSISMPMITTLFVLLMAITEEIFFRGELFDFVLSSRNIYPSAAIIISASIFMLFHLKAYGTSLNDLTFVFIGGTMLSWSAWKTKRILTPMIAHGINNLTGTQLLIPALTVLAFFFVFMTYRKKWRANLWGIK